MARFGLDRQRYADARSAEFRKRSRSGWRKAAKALIRRGSLFRKPIDFYCHLLTRS